MTENAQDARDLTTLEESMNQLRVHVKGLLDDQTAELEKHGKTTLETGAKLDKANEEWKRVEAEMAALKTHVQGLERKSARAAAGIGGGSAPKRNLVDLFFESPQAKALLDGGTYDCVPLRLNKSEVAGLELKDLNLSREELGALAPTHRHNEVIAPQLATPKLTDMVRSIPVSTDKVEYAEEVVTHELYAELESQAASGQADLVLGRSAEGFYDGQTVVIAKGTVAEETKEIDTGGVDHDTNTITLTSNLANTHAAGIDVSSDTFVFTPQVKLKPFSRLEFELREALVRTLATIIPFAKQMLRDAPMLQAWLTSRLGEFVANQKERQILYGNAGDREIQGILTHADINTYLWSSGTVGDTKLDAIRRAITLSTLSHYPADSVTLHPSDLEDIETAKGTDGHYLFVQAQSANGITRVWRVGVVESTFINAGTGMSGNLALGYVIWDRQMVEVSVSRENRDWWEKNVMGFLVEERLSSSVTRPKAMTKITFDNAPTPP